MCCVQGCRSIINLWTDYKDPGSSERMHPEDTPDRSDHFDVRVISMHLNASPAIRRVFPRAEVLAATDLRAANPRVLHEQGVITDEVLETITQGRKYHHELPTCGGVGLWQSVRLALEQGNRPLLLLEEDCVPSPELPLVVERLLGLEATPIGPPNAGGADTFDLAVFGPIRTDGLLATETPAHRGFSWCDGYFWGLHAVLYTTDGRARTRAMLTGPVDVQLDAKLSRLAVYGLPGNRLSRLRVLLQRPGEPGLARQSAHTSGIQDTSCTLCDAKARPLHTGDCVKHGGGGVLRAIGGAALFLIPTPMRMFLNI